MSAETDAQELLAETWARDGHVTVPVDPFKIAERLGIQTFSAWLDAGVSGMLLKRTGEDPRIYVHTEDSPSRQRFTCAHELGHYVRRAAAGDTEWEYVEHRDLLASEGSDPEEIYANQFAAGLLMPQDRVRELYARTERRPVAVMAHSFGVSADAMNFRLANLGLR
jgi:Zn-dependent peptidase ImmA (M78 family)